MTATAPDLIEALEGRYEIERPLGAGGMATVYLAWDHRHQRKVAVKVLHAELAASLAHERFLLEISIIAKLAHPNIVPLHDSGRTDALLYYVMPFVEGRTLRDLLLEKRTLPLAEALKITCEIADALCYAHGHGVIHRDIKPENVLLEAGHAVVADFGIARAVQVAGHGASTSSGMVVGTLAYMSPEQACGASDIDGRSDLYSLALVLLEMLTGGIPRRAASPQGFLFRWGAGSITSLGGGRRAVPRPIRRVLTKALSPAPEGRYDSVEDFAKALEAAALGAPRRALFAIALPLALAGIASLAYTAIHEPRPPPRAIHPRRVLVAPLENRTGMAALDLVGLMAADWLTEGLQRTALVETVPTTTAAEAARFVGGTRLESNHPDPMRALEAETGAGTIITGAYYRQAQRLMFRIEVVDVAGERILGVVDDVSTSVDDPIRGIEELRSRTMGWLATHYDERLTAHATAGDRPPTYESYVAFSEGLEDYISTQTADAIPGFLRAYELDSSFTLALLYASIALTNTGDYPRADSLLHIVDRSRAGLSEYHRAWLDYRKAFVLGNNSRALEAVRQAAKLGAGSKATYNLAVAALQAGHLREAREALGALEPDRGPMRGFAAYWDVLATAHHMRGDHKREYAVALEGRQRHPERLFTKVAIVRALGAMGRIGELEPELAVAPHLSRDPAGWSLGMLLTEAAAELDTHGHREGAGQLYERARAWYASSDHTSKGTWARAQVAYALGHWAEAQALVGALMDADPRNPDYLGMHGMLAARAGNVADARAASDRLAAGHPKYEFGSSSLYQARIAAILGRRQEATALLRSALAQGLAFGLWLHRDPDLSRLRGFPPFDELVRPRE